MDIFVSGGTGLVGSRLLAELSENPENKIVALRRKGSDFSIVKKYFARRFDNPDEYFNKIKWLEGDILDDFFLYENIKKDSIVYHAAAFVSFRSADAPKIRQINIEGTKNIVDICLQKGVKKLCYVSSIAALGRGKNGGKTTEEDYREAEKGSSVYSDSKYAAEMEVWRGIAEGLEAVIVNPAVILGYGDSNKGSSALFNTVYKGLKFYTKGTNGYVDALDVARAMVMLAESDIKGERFILTAGTLSYKELFYAMADGLGVKPPPYYASPLLGKIVWRLLVPFYFFSGREPVITRQTARMAAARYDYSAEKIKNATGFKFTPLEKSIKRSCEDFLNETKQK